MISIHRMFMLSPQLDYKTAVSLFKWLSNYNVDLHDPSNVDIVEYAIMKADKAYDPKRGNLLTYMKRYISLDLLHKDFLPVIDILTINDTEERTEELDLSGFSDKEIQAMYNVQKGVATPDEIKTVKGLIE